MPHSISRARRALLSVTVTLLATLMLPAAPAHAQLPDFTNRTLAAHDPNYVDRRPSRNYGAGIMVRFNAEDRFTYHWYPAHGVDDEGWTLYHFGGATVLVPNYVCDVRMALESAQDYFDRQFG